MRGGVFITKGRWEDSGRQIPIEGLKRLEMGGRSVDLVKPVPGCLLMVHISKG